MPQPSWDWKCSSSKRRCLASRYEPPCARVSCNSLTRVLALYSGVWWCVQDELAASESARADMTAEAHAAAMSASTAEILRKLAAEGGDTSPAALMEKVKEAFAEEMANVRRAHAEEVSQLKRRMEEQVMSQRLIAEEVSSRLSQTELENANLKDELLDVMVVRP